LKTVIVMDDKIKKFYAKVEKYGGWQQVPAERIYSIFSQTVKPVETGFVMAKRGYLARQIDADIFHVIKLDALKGAAYGFSYGLSLSYVPYPYIPEVRWHKSLKSVSLDLREQPQEHWVDRKGDNPQVERYLVTSMLGEKCFREELETAWALSSQRIHAWFDSARNFASILEKCEQHLNRSQTGIRYIPGPRLVRAFTYAKTGRSSEAEAELELFLNEYQEGDESRANLHAALRKVRPD
jgi:hypothetical protein